MFKFNQPSRKWLAVAATTVAAVTGIGWTDTHVVHTAGIHYDMYSEDTVPAGTRSNKIRGNEPASLDDHIRQLEKAQVDLKRELESRDWDKIEKEMEGALARINTKEIEQQVEKAMKEATLAMERVQKEQLARQLDMEKIQLEMEKARKQIETEFKNGEWDKEIKEAIEKAKESTRELTRINEQQLKAELDRVKVEMSRTRENMEKDLARAKEEIRTNKFRISESLTTARKQLDETRKEFEGYRNMVNQMEKEGLIKDKKNYRIEYNNGKLTVDGKEQSASVADRYKKYFRHKKAILTNEKDDFDLETED